MHYTNNMNIIDLTLISISDADERVIYQDFMRKFKDEGHEVYIVTPCERRLGLNSIFVESRGVQILNVKPQNSQKQIS